MDMALILRRSDAMVQFHPEGLMTFFEFKMPQRISVDQNEE